MILILRQSATTEQLQQMAETYDGIMVKLAVDVNRQILAGGGELHADCEQALLADGSRQNDVWGADWYPALKRVGFESLINIRPGQGNYGFEVRDPALRETIEKVVRALLEGTS
jgi:hypothetical protein